MRKVIGDSKSVLMQKTNGPFPLIYFMKAMKNFRDRSDAFGSEDSMKRAAKLDPIKKSGKERHALYSRMHEDEDEDWELLSVKKRDSILDYYDDGQDEEDLDAELSEDSEWEDEEEQEEDEDREDEGNR